MPSIVHFDIACDEPSRGKEFFESLFGWKMNAPSGFPDYYLFDTNNLDGTTGPGGGLGKRENSTQKITVYFGIDSVEKYAAKVKKLGGQVLTTKMPVAGWGWLMICLDTEGNNFGLWQDDKQAG